jgi:hypothetical protein
MLYCASESQELIEARLFYRPQKRFDPGIELFPRLFVRGVGRFLPSTHSANFPGACGRASRGIWLPESFSTGKIFELQHALGTKLPRMATMRHTAGVLMHKMADKTYVIERVVRKRLRSLDREQEIRKYTEADRKLCKNYAIIVEQEPGSGGKESVENTI